MSNLDKSISDSIKILTRPIQNPVLQDPCLNMAKMVLRAAH